MYYCEHGECGMFKDFSSNECCLFCDRKKECIGYCTKIKDLGGVVGICKYAIKEDEI